MLDEIFFLSSDKTFPHIPRLVSCRKRKKEKKTCLMDTSAVLIQSLDSFDSNHFAAGVTL